MISHSEIKRAFDLFLSCVTIALVALTFASLCGRYHWLCDLVANLRVQWFVGILIWIALCWASQRGRLSKQLLCLALLLLVHLPGLVPAWTDGRAGVDTDIETAGDAIGSLRIVTTNVLTSNLRHDEIIAELKQIDPDVLVVIELSTDLSERLRTEFGDSHPHQMLLPEDAGNFGIGMLSRYPLGKPEAFEVAGGPVAVQAEVGGYRVIGVHTYPPMGASGFGYRREQLRFLADFVGEDLKMAERTIVVGDLNVTPWSPHFVDFVEAAQLRRTGLGLNVAPTWFVRPTFLMGLTLDHILIGKGLHCTEFAVGRDCGSDHRSVSATISLTAESKQ
ncbi:endonuclease/exonuclease/phosphatase family protein [Neorhodopirellula lusitana]|uniref:endonuclease/exonuclease/phosphatase family protein n=1 Tax=Neorhodopirellula lusitana TaxID=445327 RepID=UPI0024B74C67|nr:endonuclease/exonuclease/phosphatase family protein [Neorhodopirellula lusitana]